VEREITILIVAAILAGLCIGGMVSALYVIHITVRRLTDVLEYDRDPTGYMARRSLRAPEPPPREASGDRALPEDVE
jgi:hypothetical protein